MLICKNNVRLSNNTFIDNIYDIYSTLVNQKAFTETGFETSGYKMWKSNDWYYILDKSTGMLICWYKLLGWNLACNTTLKDDEWKRFCQRLAEDLENNKVTRVEPDAFLEEKPAYICKTRKNDKSNS